MTMTTATMSRHAAKSTVASAQNRKIRPAGDGGRINGATSFRRGLGFHIDDLNAAVDRVHRGVRVLRLGLAIADGDEIGAVDAAFLGEVPLDGIGAALGQVLR